MRTFDSLHDLHEAIGEPIFISPMPNMSASAETATDFTFSAPTEVPPVRGDALLMFDCKNAGALGDYCTAFRAAGRYYIERPCTRHRT